jgi:hypothetical protein
MTDNPNIEDVTNSPKDWQDFWENEDKRPEDDVNEFTELPIENRYVDDIINGNGTFCKRESLLSD